ncbi:hypothetical protein GCM10009630_46110 [Kribbella jejuensis]
MQRWVRVVEWQWAGCTRCGSGAGADAGGWWVEWQRVVVQGWVPCGCRGGGGVTERLGVVAVTGGWGEAGE